MAAADDPAAVRLLFTNWDKPSVVISMVCPLLLSALLAVAILFALTIGRYPLKRAPSASHLVRLALGRTMRAPRVTSCCSAASPRPEFFVRQRPLIIGS
ncbi:hypothetical protein AFEL58S_03467 [Afipia felis]